MPLVHAAPSMGGWEGSKDLLQPDAFEIHVSSDLQWLGRPLARSALSSTRQAGCKCFIFNLFSSFFPFRSQEHRQETGPGCHSFTFLSNLLPVDKAPPPPAAQDPISIWSFCCKRSSAVVSTSTRFLCGDAKTCQKGTNVTLSAT